MTMNEQNSGVGTELKINLHMEPMGEYRLSNVEFTATVFSAETRERVVIDKASALAVDDDNYILIVDSSIVGIGRYFVTLCAYIPDVDMPSGFRKEVATVYSGITIVR